ncbi:MAG: pyridoxamine kinase [Lachnospiraceae bacterium]|nr:pyridoxamine kinase [Lachnospiraceae bacterium]
MVDHNRQKKIAVINDFSGFGRCSIAVSLPIISAMGIQCCPLPTAMFSNHTGFESFYRVDFTGHMRQYMSEWDKLGLQFSGIATGFLGSEEQIEIVADFLQEFATDDTIVLIDPVMGDYGKLYPSYSEKLAMKMHRLIPYADILTPNLTEACILTKTEYREDITTKELRVLCDELARQCDTDKNIKIVISGLNRDRYLENFVYERDTEPQLVMTPKIGSNRSGTGDVFSSIIAGCAVRGMEFRESVWMASEFIGRCMKTTMEMGLPGTDGIAFEEHLFELR